MENGIAKPQDIKAFSHRIHSEAKRMITLVDDIIGLSRLDDGTADTAKEPIKLLEAAKTTADILKDSAKSAASPLSVEGDDI